MSSLRELQVDALLKMLYLNEEHYPRASSATEDPNATTAAIASDTAVQDIVWKVLVLDKKTTAIVSSVLRVNDLLKTGVTVHALIDSAKRSSLPDVPVVYFIEPTLENVNTIIDDIKNSKYSEFYVNFVDTLNRDLLEHLAKEVVQLGKQDKIKQVYDQYLDFVVTEPELFSLELPTAYITLNDPSTTEENITSLCSRIADGLFNTVITLNSIPIIRAPKNGPAEIVAEKLANRLRDYVINMKSNSSQNDSGSNSILNDSLDRSVLIILDRNIDYSSMFSHSWIYQCMVFDIFKLRRNTISIPAESEDAKAKQYDIEPHDFFWNQNSHLPFPEAAENVESALDKYKQEANEIIKKTGVSNLNDLNIKQFDQQNQDDDLGTLQIQQAVKKLPELTAKKSIIDMHMNIFASLLKELEAKNLDTFFEIEQQDPDNVKTRTKFLELLKNDGKTNNLDDKLRSFIVLYLSAKSTLPKDFVNEVESYFKSQEYDISVLSYVYKLREMMKMSSSMSLQTKSLDDGTSNASKTGTSTLSGLYGLTEGTLQGGVGSLISGFKKLLPEKKTIPVTNIVDAIMEPLSSSQKNLEATDSYLYLDPKITRGSHTRKPKRQTYNKSVVFVVGGGNYLEYQNLQEWAHSQIHNPKKVMYGSTDIISPHDFLSQLTSLSK
ncbi:syntaxin-binding protein [Nakaseomyces bracarensis]|uniref:syntaxin-binding protein n=1 Tax=Nakaseomyces bracarensis TaxID=273131 RepID=UPI0038711385